MNPTLFALLQQLGGILVSSLLGAIFLRIALEWVAKKKATYWQLYVVMIVTGLTSLAFQQGLTPWLAGRAEAGSRPLVEAICLVFQFAVHAWVFSKMLKISFGKGALLLPAILAGILILWAVLALVAMLVRLFRGAQ